MAVDLHATTTCNGETEQTPGEPPTTAVHGGEPEKVVYKKGAWSKEEDEKLRKAVEQYGLRNWVTIEKYSGLARPAKNCRLRWLNYLRPNLKKCPFTEEEEKLILHLHSKYGNSWSRIASKLPGRSDNEIKNFWHKRAKKCQKQQLPIYPTSQERKQSHTNVNEKHYNDETNGDDGYFPNYDNIPTNCPSYPLPSTSIYSPQFQPSTLNIVKNACHPTHPQFLSTSHTQTSTDHLTHQTTLYPNTPASQTHNLLLWQGDATSNAFTLLRNPPILSSTEGWLRRFSTPTTEFSPTDHSISFLPPDSSLQMQWSSALESPTSPLKLKLSPCVPPLYSVQMSTETTDSPVTSSSAFQLKSPKLHLSIPVPSESFFQSNLSIPDSTTELDSSKAAAVPLSSVQLQPSSCGPDLLSIQPVTGDTDQEVPPDSSLTVKTEPPSIQSYPPETPGANSCVHELESDSNVEIMKELREAQARVRFLKKKLRQRRISSKRTLLKESESAATTDLYGRKLAEEVPVDRNSSQSTTKECLLPTSSRTKNFLGDILRASAPAKNSRTKDMLKTILRQKGGMISKTRALQVKKARKKNRLCKLWKRENLESGKHIQESIELEKVTQGENSETQDSQREEDSQGQILHRKNSMTFQEQGDSINLFDNVNSQSTVTAPTSDLQDNKLCPYEVLSGKCLNKCATVESLFSESSTPLQDSFLKRELFGQRSEIEDPSSSERNVRLIDAFGPVYNQTTATTPVKPGEECGYFGYSFGREFSDGLETKFAEDGLMDGNLAAKSILFESNLLMHQYPTGHLLDSSYLVSKPNMEHASLGGEQCPLQTSGRVNSAESLKLCESSLLLHQCPAADLLDSGYPVRKQIVEQESPGDEQFSLQTLGSGNGNSAETSKICESTSLMQQYPAANLTDSTYARGFRHECPRSEQYSLQTSAGGFYRGGTEGASSETWRREPIREKSLMESLLSENLWPEGQMVSQDQTLSTNRFDSVVDPSAMTQLMESNKWDDELCISPTGVVKQEQEQDHMNTMHDELSNLLEFFPSTIQTLEWYSCDAGPDIVAFY